MNDIFKAYDFENEQQWLKGRMSGIGGSDASAVVGMNPYKSREELKRSIGILHKGQTCNSTLDGRRRQHECNAIVKYP